MTAPRLYDSDISRWRSRVESLEETVSRLERTVGDVERDANRTAMDLSRQKDNLFLVAFAIVEALVIALAIASRH